MRNLLQTIKTLSEIDEKNLTAKTLKLGEEFGELAKAVLPYENAFATTHRFVTSNKILEEVVDTILCSLSIVYDIGYTDEDIYDMMVQKCVKWNKLQQANIKGRFPLPFEIHITVRLGDGEKLASQNLIELFKDTCIGCGVKAIVLDLKDGVQDMMTSSVAMTDNVGAYTEMVRVRDYIISQGFNVVREKIETVPWHPAAPFDDYTEINDNRYFESHISIIVNATERERLIEYCGLLLPDLHLSKNIFKKLNDTDFIQMATLRSSNTVYSRDIRTFVTFDAYLTSIIEDLSSVSFLREGAILKKVVEYAIYDTNIAHDISWLSVDTGNASNE